MLYLHARARSPPMLPELQTAAGYFNGYFCPGGRISPPAQLCLATLIDPQERCHSRLAACSAGRATGCQPAAQRCSQQEFGVPLMLWGWPEAPGADSSAAQTQSSLSAT